MDLGGYTAIGPRDANEDNYFTLDFSNVNSFSNGVTSFAMVSDGMGGYQGGDVASGLAVSSAESYLNQLLEMAAGNQLDFDAQSALGEIVLNAHEAILAEARARGGTSMGATFVGVFLSPTHAWIGHVGDSRAYLVRGGEITQITEDHSQVGRMLSRGLITEEEAQNHPARNRIERALGFSEAEPEFNEVDLEPGDVLMLCSDGVYTVLGRETICGCIQGGRDAESAAKRIVKTALNQGTDDNSTAVVAANVKGVPGRGQRRRSQPTIRTSAVAGPRYGAVVPVRTGSSRSGKRMATSDRGQRSGRSLRTAVIPIAVAVVAVAAIAVAFALANNGAVGGGAPPSDAPASPAPPPSTSASSAPAIPQPSTSSSSTASADSPEMNVGGGPLRYADSNGQAYTFDEELGVSNSLFVANARLQPSIQSYYVVDGSGNRVSRNYLTLQSSYRSALVSDYSSYYGSGTLGQSSEFSGIVEADHAYLTFLNQLKSAGITPEDLQEKVFFLLLDPQDASSTNEANY